MVNKLKGGRKNFTLDPCLLQQNIYQLKPNSKIFSLPWSRGHLVPSYIMSWDKSLNGAWHKTYHMSNIIPQNRTLNMSNWCRIERETLNIIKQNKEPVYVITGSDNINNPPFFETLNSQKKYLYKVPVYNFKYQTRFNTPPNIMYQIVISEFETKCWIASNDQRQMVKKIKLRELEELIEKNIFYQNI